MWIFQVILKKWSCALFINMIITIFLPGFHSFSYTYVTYFIRNPWWRENVNLHTVTMHSPLLSNSTQYTADKWPRILRCWRNKITSITTCKTTFKHNQHIVLSSFNHSLNSQIFQNLYFISFSLKSGYPQPTKISIYSRNACKPVSGWFCFALDPNVGV